MYIFVMFLSNMKMRKYAIVTQIFFFTLLFFFSCKNKQGKIKDFESNRMKIRQEIIESIALPLPVLSKEEHEKLTPDKVLEQLKAGNQKFFTEDSLIIRYNTAEARSKSLQQYPEAVILTCSDLRMPVEDIFHKRFGSLSTVKNSGNVISDDVLGSLEHECQISGAKLILVLGHENCQTIKSAINNLKSGNITDQLSHIQPAISIAEEGFVGDRSSWDQAYIEAVCYNNVEQSIREIREKSALLEKMETAGKIKIAGAVYDMETGIVVFLQE